MSFKVNCQTPPTNSTMNTLSHMQMWGKYNCEKCRFSTKDLNKYNIHIALHNEMKYVCAHCNFESYTKTEFQRHLVSHTGKFPYTCEYCGYGAIRNDYIVKHIKRIHGDGKIQCSVSTLENESKNASINIVQTQMRNSLQEILPNNTTVIAKDLIDLTSEWENSIFNNGSHLNGNRSPRTDQVQVEVVSPTDQQLFPWMPLTVVAPTSFQVPDNCFVRVVEVKPVHGACHLVLKCLEVIESNETKKVFLKEQNISEPMVTSLNCEGPCGGSSLVPSGMENLLSTKDAASLSEENPNSLNHRLNDGEIMNTLQAVPNELYDENEEISDGPIISSVFSLSADSKNVIEGIHWESPIVVPNANASNDITTPSLNGMESQGVNVAIETASQQKAVQENKLPEVNTMEVKNAGLEIQLPINKPFLPYGKKPESQTSAMTQSNKRGGRKLNRLSKIETDLFSKPQTLFLSYDKRIVMQPLSCVMQTGHKAAVGRENELVPLKVKKQSVKTKGKTFTKGFGAPVLKTLRLYPVKADQLTRVPHRNQPVVVLNHPEMESLEVSSIMKAIGMFKGMVLKVTLSKQTRRKII